MASPAPYQSPEPPAPLGDRDHPAPRTIIVLPSWKSDSETVRALLTVIQDAYRSFAGNNATCNKNVAEADGDRLAQAILYGQAVAYSAAAEHMEQAVVDTFDLWQQTEAQQPSGPTDTAAYHFDFDRDRPDVEIPADDPALTRLRNLRDRMVWLAAHAQDLAWQLGQPTNPQQHIIFQTRYSRAITWAGAADLVDEAIAAIIGQSNQYQGLIAQHGTWLTRTA